MPSACACAWQASDFFSLRYPPSSQMRTKLFWLVSEKNIYARAISLRTPSPPCDSLSRVSLFRHPRKWLGKKNSITMAPRYERWRCLWNFTGVNRYLYTIGHLEKIIKHNSKTKSLPGSYFKTLLMTTVWS